jgi:hypothetical protein
LELGAKRQWLLVDDDEHRMGHLVALLVRVTISGRYRAVWGYFTCNPTQY